MVWYGDCGNRGVWLSDLRIPKGFALSHVMLGGDEQQVAELRILLAERGVTVGWLGASGLVPTVFECDTVIWAGNPDEYSGACLGTLPDGSGGAAGPAAPLIFIVADQVSESGAESGELPKGGLSVAVAAGGGGLWSSLGVTFRTAQELRGIPAGRNYVCSSPAVDSDHYLHFLGHELRSPLTAIKTALEVLAGDIADPEQRSGRVVEKMVNIALRNVRRLHQTMDWSQELLAGEVSPAVMRPRVFRVDELAAVLADLGSVESVGVSSDTALETDAYLLYSVVVQMVRVARMVNPASSPTIQLNSPSGDRDVLELTVIYTDDGADPAEAERLVQYMISAPLVSALGGQLRRRTVSGDQQGVTISLDTLPVMLPVCR